MSENILALLTTKFVGVPNAILKRMALKRAKTIITEEQATLFVEGLTLQDLFQSYGDSRATEAVKTVIVNREKKYGLKNSQIYGGRNSKPNRKLNGDDGEPNVSDALLKVIENSLDPLIEKLDCCIQHIRTAKRTEEILESARKYGIPTAFISRLYIAEDIDLDDYMTGVKQCLFNLGFESEKHFGKDVSDPGEGDGYTDLDNPDLKEICRPETIYHLSGSFILSDDNLKEGVLLPQFTPLSIDYNTRKAVAVKNIRVIENVEPESTMIKVLKNSLVYTHMFIGNGSDGAKVISIDRTDKNYDLITIETALGCIVKAGDVLFEASGPDGHDVKYIANALSYPQTKVTSERVVRAVGQVYEIKESRLIAPVSFKDKEYLGNRFLFVG